MIFRSITFLLFTCFITCTTPPSHEFRLKVNNFFGGASTRTIETKSPATGVPIEPENCVCVDYFLCNNSKVITDGRGVIDIRGNDGKCLDYTQWCCNLGDIAEEKILPDESKSSVCGQRNPNGAGFRITGDVNGEAQFGEFPWMVAILHDQGEGALTEKYQCGGSLIHPQVVMTAAHCVIDKSKTFTIRAGEWDTQTTKEIYPHQDRKVRSIIIHPGYYSGPLYNDVALAIVERPFDLNLHINVACLPPPKTFTPDGTTCLVSGWGKNKFGAAGKYQVIMKKIDLPFVNRDNCQSKLRRTRLGKYFELHNSFVCAGGEGGKDACEGDGGGPLVCPIPGKPGRYQQLGIVAWGIGCAMDDVPGVYGNVASFRSWLDDQMNNYGFGTSTYSY